MIGIEVGQRYQRQDFSRPRVEHHTRGAKRHEFRHRGAQLVVQRALHAHVQGQPDGPAPPRRGGRQHLIEAPLDTREPTVIDAGKANRMGGKRALRVDSVALRYEADAGDAQTVDRVVLLGCQIPFEPDERSLRRQLLQ